MDSCLIEISDSDLKNKKIRIASCGSDFFPEDAYGDPSSKSGQSGKEITLLVDGVEKPVKTDIPTDKKIFRSRYWIKEFFQQNLIKPKDKIKIERISHRQISLIQIPNTLLYN